MEKTSINSFLGKGHEYHLYVYEHVGNTPEGVIIKNANDIIDRDDKSKYKGGKDYATFSDIFRYKLLLEKGGIWVDTDIICIKPFNFKNDYVFASERVERQKKWEVKFPSKPVGCVIKSPPRSKIMSYCLDKSRQKKFEDIEWAEVGPDLLSKAIREFDMEKNIFFPWKFCPISWWNWRRFVSQSMKDKVVEMAKKLVAKPYSYHLWNSKWSEGGESKNKVYPENTIYGRMQKKYLPSDQ